MKCQAEWSSGWSQDCREKYQPSQKCRWYNPPGRKRRIKEPLDEGERGEWKTWLKTQHYRNEDHGIQFHHFMATIDREKMETVADFYFLGLQSHCRWWLQPWNYKMLAPWKKSRNKPDRVLKIRHIALPTKIDVVKCSFSRSHVHMWELGHQQGWLQKNWCFWIVVLKTLESPLNFREIKSVSPKGNQSWIFIGRTGAEAEALILWLPDGKN